MMASMRTYEILLDGQMVGLLKNGESKTIEITPGHHLIFIRLLWAIGDFHKTVSATLSFDMNAGGSAAFSCQSTTLGTGIHLSRQ